MYKEYPGKLKCFFIFDKIKNWQIGETVEPD